MLRHNLLLALAAALLGAVCELGSDLAPAAVGAVYDGRTGRLIRLDYDGNHDGRVDVRTYMDGNRLRRAEADTDGDGVVDRWEYFDATARLARVGGSSAGDGVEDTWMSTEPGTGLTRMEYSTRRDRTVDRREFLSDATLVRAEEDTTGDGLPDKWESYENGRLATVALDTTHRAGTPDRRLVYAPNGDLIRIEPLGTAR